MTHILHVLHELLRMCGLIRVSEESACACTDTVWTETGVVKQSKAASEWESTSALTDNFGQHCLLNLFVTASSKAIIPPVCRAAWVSRYTQWVKHQTAVIFCVNVVMMHRV